MDLKVQKNYDYFNLNLTICIGVLSRFDKNIFMRNFILFFVVLFSFNFLHSQDFLLLFLIPFLINFPPLVLLIIFLVFTLKLNFNPLVFFVIFLFPIVYLGIILCVFLERI